MKNTFLILICCITSCNSIKDIKNNDNIHVFYFDEQDKNMNKYITTGGVKFWFSREAEDVLFIPQNLVNKNNEFAPNFNYKKIKVSEKDTIGLNIKTIDWLKKMDNMEIDDFFFGKGSYEDIYYILEKNANNGNLYLIEVDYVQEID